MVCVEYLISHRWDHSYSHIPPTNFLEITFHPLNTSRLGRFWLSWLLKSFGQFVCSSTPFKTKGVTLLNLTPTFPKLPTTSMASVPLSFCAVYILEMSGWSFRKNLKQDCGFCVRCLLYTFTKNRLAIFSWYIYIYIWCTSTFKNHTNLVLLLRLSSYNFQAHFMSTTEVQPPSIISFVSG